MPQASAHRQRRAQPRQAARPGWQRLGRKYVAGPGRNV